MSKLTPKQRREAEFLEHHTNSYTKVNSGTYQHNDYPAILYFPTTKRLKITDKYGRALYFQNIEPDNIESVHALPLESQETHPNLYNIVR